MVTATDYKLAARRRLGKLAAIRRLVVDALDDELEPRNLVPALRKMLAIIDDDLVTVDELVRALSGPHDERAAVRAMRKALFHLAPGRLEELDGAADAADAAEPERVDPEVDRCVCNPAFGTDSRCPKHGEPEESDPTVGPLEQWTLDTMVYPDGGPAAPDDIVNAVSQLAGVLDDATDELGRLTLGMKAGREPGAQCLRRIVEILRLENGT